MHIRNGLLQALLASVCPFGYGLALKMLPPDERGKHDEGASTAAKVLSELNAITIEGEAFRLRKRSDIESTRQNNDSVGRGQSRVQETFPAIQASQTPAHSVAAPPMPPFPAWQTAQTHVNWHLERGEYNEALKIGITTRDAHKEHVAQLAKHQPEYGSWAEVMDWHDSDRHEFGSLRCGAASPQSSVCSRKRGRSGKKPAQSPMPRHPRDVPSTRRNTYSRLQSAYGAVVLGAMGMNNVHLPSVPVLMAEHGQPTKSGSSQGSAEPQRGGRQIDRSKDRTHTGKGQKRVDPEQPEARTNDHERTRKSRGRPHLADDDLESTADSRQQPARDQDDLPKEPRQQRRSDSTNELAMSRRANDSPDVRWRGFKR